jgi:hypothetical protein
MPTDQRLLPRHKNSIFQVIEKIGLNPTRFKWEDETSDFRTISKLTCKSSPFFYRFGVLPKGWYKCERCPGSKLPMDDIYFDSWGQIGGDFALWAARVQAELEAPDLWAEAQKYASAFPLSPANMGQDETFTEEEAQRVISAVKEVEQRIVEELVFTHRELAFIQDRLSYLESRAKEGYYKIDWVNLLFSTLINVGANLSLDPAKAHQIWLFFKEALSPVMRLIGG